MLSPHIAILNNYGSLVTFTAGLAADDNFQTLNIGKECRKAFRGTIIGEGNAINFIRRGGILDALLEQRNGRLK